KLSGIHVRVLVEPVSVPTGRAQAYETARRKLLADLGIVVQEVKSLPLRGYFFDPMDDNHANAVLYLNRSNPYLPLAVYYGGVHNVDVVKLSYDKLSTLANFGIEDSRQPKLVPYNDSELRNDLKKRVPQYYKADISNEEVVIGDNSYLSVR